MGQILQYASEHQRQSLIVLWGSPLVGKSALAKQVMVALHPLYPDRKMIIDLKGMTYSYVGFSEARLSVIRQCHPSVDIPPTEAEIRGLYESCFADLQCVLLIENVGSAQQVMELVPVSAKSCCILVTTRHEIELDAVTECLCLRLMPLSTEQGMEIFERIVGPQFMASHPREAVQQLVDLCSGRALFIRVIGALVSRAPDKFDSVLHRLSDREEKYDFFARTLPYDALDPELVDCYLPLGVFKGTFSKEAAVAVWGAEGPYPSRERKAGEDVCSKALDDLLASALLQEVPPHRYQLPDVLQVHCFRQAKETMPDKLRLWRQRFIQFFLDLLGKLKRLIFDYARDDAAHIFIQERDNFELAVDYARHINNDALATQLARSVEWFTKHTLSAFEHGAWKSFLHNPRRSSSTSQISHAQLNHDHTTPRSQTPPLPTSVRIPNSK